MSARSRELRLWIAFVAFLAMSGAESFLQHPSPVRIGFYGTMLAGILGFQGALKRGR